MPSREAADALALALVEARWAACVQIGGPVESVYRWDGKIERATEWSLSIKTVSRLYQELEQFLIEKHDYDVPQIVAEKVAASESYAAWLRDQLR
jgi:periplasmic divalent cation tolerance protein